MPVSSLDVSAFFFDSRQIKFGGVCAKKDNNLIGIICWLFLRFVFEHFNIFADRLGCSYKVLMSLALIFRKIKRPKNIGV